MAKTKREKKMTLAIWNIYADAPMQWFATRAGFQQPNAKRIGTATARTEAEAISKIYERLIEASYDS